MRIEAIEYEVYTFSELSEKAKEKVRTWYLDGREAFIFTEDCENYLMDKFHNSDLKVVAGILRRILFLIWNTIT